MIDTNSLRATLKSQLETALGIPGYGHVNAFPNGLLAYFNIFEDGRRPHYDIVGDMTITVTYVVEICLLLYDNNTKTFRHSIVYDEMSDYLDAMSNWLAEEKKTHSLAMNITIPDRSRSDVVAAISGGWFYLINYFPFEVTV